MLKVVSSIPCCRWFGYTLTHSLVVSLLSPNHPLVMGSPHGPQLTYLLNHILLGFFFLLLDCSHIVLGFFFCGVNNTLSILFLDHFACKMGLIISLLYIKYYYIFFPNYILVLHSVEEILFVYVAWCRRINNLHNSKYTFQIVRVISIEWKLRTNLSLLIALIITLFLYSVTITRCFTYKPFSYTF